MKSPFSRASSKPALQPVVRQASRLHRWLGTGFALMFLLWFGSGFVMMYVPFPSLGERARIAALPPVDLAAVTVGPAEAVRGLEIRGLRLVDVLGRPRYLATLADGSVRSIAADGGGEPGFLDAPGALRLAQAFANAPASAVTGPFDHDQWVVHPRFDAARPFYKVAAGDAAGTEVYVSARLGQVLQRTTRFERGWNRVGAVVHWIYPTVLRKSQWAWDQVVWWLALAGVAVAGSGYALGLVRMLRQRRGGRGGVSPFRGWLRWHHLLGLTGGLFAFTWVFSGWLSMDHGRLFSLDQPDPARIARFQGIDMGSALDGLTPAMLRRLGGAPEIAFLAVGGRGFVLQRGADDGADRLVPLVRGVPQAPIAALPDALLVRAAAQAWAPARVSGIGGIAADDAYGRTRSEPLPPGARRIQLADAGKTWVHVDAHSGAVLNQMDASRRAYRWLYTGLHTFDFPWLNRAGPLWEVLMLLALAAGLGLSASAFVLGKRRIQRSAARCACPDG